MIQGNYTDTFKRNGSVAWVCPTCEKSFLKIVTNTFYTEQTRDSRVEQQSLETAGPETLGYQYSCLLVCNNPPCKETVSSCGYGFMEPEPEQDEDGNWDNNWTEYFKPQFFSPHLKIFPIPKKCPHSVRSEINNSFALFFCSPSSSGSHIRKSIENLLDHLKVARYTVKNGKKSPISLHGRIDKLKPKYAHVKDLLFAIKWIGNAGSHENLKTKDVLDSYKLTSRVLEELYDNKATEAAKLAKEINKKKGPLTTKAKPNLYKLLTKNSV